MLFVHDDTSRELKYTLSYTRCLLDILVYICFAKIDPLTTRFSGCCGASSLGQFRAPCCRRVPRPIGPDPTRRPQIYSKAATVYHHFAQEQQRQCSTHNEKSPKQNITIPRSTITHRSTRPEEFSRNLLPRSRPRARASHCTRRTSRSTHQARTRRWRARKDGC